MFTDFEDSNIEITVADPQNVVLAFRTELQLDRVVCQFNAEMGPMQEICCAGTLWSLFYRFSYQLALLKVAWIRYHSLSNFSTRTLTQLHASGSFEFSFIRRSSHWFHVVFGKKISRCILDKRRKRHSNCFLWYTFRTPNLRVQKPTTSLKLLAGYSSSGSRVLSDGNFNNYMIQ